jgi:hypothetical protein
MPLLAAAGSCASQVCATPDQLLQAVQDFDPSTLQPFPAGDAGGIVAAIDSFMGRPCKPE